MVAYLSPRLLGLILLLPFLLSTTEVDLNRTPESIGRDVFEAIQGKDFKRLEILMPTEQLVAKMLESEANPNASSPAAVLGKMKQKMREEFDEILKSAKKHRVKLDKLEFGGILKNEQNPESAFTIRALEMELRWQGKPVDLAYTVLEYEGESYYTGILISKDLFSQLQG